MYLSVYGIITRVGFLMCIKQITLFRIFFRFFLHFKRMLHVFYIENFYPDLDLDNSNKTLASFSRFEPVSCRV